MFNQTPWQPGQSCGVSMDFGLLGETTKTEEKQIGPPSRQLEEAASTVTQHPGPFLSNEGREEEQRP